jgi:predicted acylesterase/phospholipase RssA
MTAGAVNAVLAALGMRADELLARAERQMRGGDVAGSLITLLDAAALLDEGLDQWDAPVPADGDPPGPSGDRRPGC